MATRPGADTTPTTPMTGTARPARPTGSLSAWEGMARQYDYWLTVLKRTWRGGVVSSFLTPLLYVVAMGVLLGGFIEADPDQLECATSYLAFVVPGLVASHAMTLAVSESTYPVMGSIKWHKTFFAQLATPLAVRVSAGARAVVVTDPSGTSERFTADVSAGMSAARHVAFGSVPPAAAASRASRTAGKASSSSGSKRHSCAVEKSSAGWAPGTRRGQSSAKEMGSFMDGGEHCAMVQPSVKVAIECTMDWGWTVTSMLSGATSKSSVASISSSPLLTSVAEFSVFICPMDHVGC